MTLAPAKIIFLDDEQNILNALRRCLQDEGHDLIFTLSPEEALERVGKEEIAVAVSDQRMPAMNGTQFLERVKALSPETVRILLTGHSDFDVAMEAINRGAVYRFLAKPWNDTELRSTIRQAAAHHELVAENRRLHELTWVQNGQLKELNEGLEAKVKERTARIEGLNRELERSLMGSVKVLAGLTEVQSATIGVHSRRVAVLSKELAVKLGMTREEAMQVEIGGLLHDLGKLSMPSSLLTRLEIDLKPQEKELLERHPALGEALVRMVQNMEMAAHCVRHHHERFYGGGYPDNLKGEEIPLGARIIALADAYDKALNNRSAYQFNSPDKTFLHLRNRSPEEFDPKVVDALGRCLLDGDRLVREAGEIEVGYRDLQPGMVLSRDIRNTRGILLLQSRSMITEEVLRKIKEYADSNQALEGVHILRREARAMEKG